MHQTIKLMADYQSWPLWWSGDHDPGNIDPALLPISPEVQARLQAWADTFDSFMDWDNPSSSDEPSPDQFVSFEQEGFKLWCELRKQLAPEYTVEYFSATRRRIFTDPEDLNL